jgi:hypothetical protein
MEGAAVFLAKEQKQFLTLKKMPLLLMRYKIESVNGSDPLTDNRVN